MNPLWNELKIKSKCKIHFVFCKFSLFLTFLWNSKELSEECWSWTRAVFHVINTLFPILSQIFRRLLWAIYKKINRYQTNHHFNKLKFKHLLLFNTQLTETQHSKISNFNINSISGNFKHFVILKIWKHLTLEIRLN